MSCTWRIDVADIGEREASAAVSLALDAPTLLVERMRKGRTVVDDIRPSLVSARVEYGLSDGARIVANLGTQPRATRPTELLAGLSRALRVRRLHQWIATDAGQRHEPLACVSGFAVAGSGAAI